MTDTRHAARRIVQQVAHVHSKTCSPAIRESAVEHAIREIVALVEGREVEIPDVRQGSFAIVPASAWLAQVGRSAP